MWEQEGKPDWFTVAIFGLHGSMAPLNTTLWQSNATSQARRPKSGVSTVTALVRRNSPNLQKKRVYVAELEKTVTIKVSTKGLRTITKNGAYATLKKANLI